MSNVSIESVSHVVGSIYEAAYDQERWLDVMTGYAPVDRQWKLFGISVNLSKGGPQAPETPVAEQPADAGPPPDAPSTAVQPKKAAKQ